MPYAIEIVFVLYFRNAKGRFVSWIAMMTFLFEETSPLKVQNINLSDEPGHKRDFG